MTKYHRRRSYALTLMIATAALELGSNRARAQWEFPWMGFGGFNYVPSPGEYLNQHALVRAQNAARGPVQNNVYSNNPNAYFNRIRDNGLTPHFSHETRMSPGHQASTRRRPASVTQTRSTQPQPAATMPTVPRPVVPIGSFFDASRRFVWPADAPGGNLLAKRDISDQACLSVADLVKKHGSAPITTVTTARQKLLDYGQPALQVMQSTMTPRVADTFHLFLMSLYESLAQAANPPEATPVSTPAP